MSRKLVLLNNGNWCISQTSASWQVDINSNNELWRGVENFNDGKVVMLITLLCISFKQHLHIQIEQLGFFYPPPPNMVTYNRKSPTCIYNVVFVHTVFNLCSQESGICFALSKTECILIFLIYGVYIIEVTLFKNFLALPEFRKRSRSALCNASFLPTLWLVVENGQIETLKNVKCGPFRLQRPPGLKKRKEKKLVAPQWNAHNRHDCASPSSPRVH